MSPPTLSKALGAIKRPLLLAGVAVALGAGTTMPDGRPTPTGFEVPRWIALSSSEVYGRRGPGTDHPILWKYTARGLPVQVIAETREWRKVCDPEGSVVWIHRTVTSGRRRVFNTGAEAVPIHSGRDASSAIKARLGPRSLISAEDCEDGWCRVRESRLRGWVQESAVFGTATTARCDWRRPAGPAAG